MKSINYFNQKNHQPHVVQAFTMLVFRDGKMETVNLSYLHCYPNYIMNLAFLPVNTMLQCATQKHDRNSSCYPNVLPRTSPLVTKLAWTAGNLESHF